MGIKLTERIIERLACEPGKRDPMVFETEQRGLAVRVVATGSKTYLAQYVTAGRKRRVPLGSVDAISLAAARHAARAVMDQVAQGTDPATQRKAKAEDAKVEAHRERLTLARLVADWKRLHLARRSARYRKLHPRFRLISFPRAFVRSGGVLRSIVRELGVLKLAAMNERPTA